MVALIGSGWVFLLNAASFAVTIVALLVMRSSELFPQVRREGRVRLVQGLRYVRGRRDQLLVLALAFGVATFGLNYQMTMALMARQQFGLGAEAFGVMSTALAVGALAGSLLAARRTRIGLRLVLVAALVFGTVEILVGLSPTYWVMLLALPFAGVLAMTFTTSSQSYLQSHSAAWVRGRVMGIYTLVFFGGTPIGAPIIGWAADRFGPRSGLIGGGLGTVVWTAVAGLVYWLTRERDHSGAESDLASEPQASEESASRSCTSGVESGQHEGEPRRAVRGDPHRDAPVLLVHVAGGELRGPRRVRVVARRGAHRHVQHPGVDPGLGRVGDPQRASELGTAPAPRRRAARAATRTRRDASRARTGRRASGQPAG